MSTPASKPGVPQTDDGLTPTPNAKPSDCAMLDDSSRSSFLGSPWTQTGIQHWPKWISARLVFGKYLANTCPNILPHI